MAEPPLNCPHCGNAISIAARVNVEFDVEAALPAATAESDGGLDALWKLANEETRARFVRLLREEMRRWERRYA